MIQDILPKKLDNAYKNRKPQENSRMLGFGDRTVYLKNEGKIEFLTYGQLKTYYETVLKKEVPESVYLFSVDKKSNFGERNCQEDPGIEDSCKEDDNQEDYFLTDIPEEVQIEGFAFHKMFDTRAMQPKESVLAAATAWHLYVWYRDNQFCGRCATKLVHSDKLRMMQCPECGNMVFPKIAPAVIVGLTHGDEILMTKYAGREYKRYALIAGFTEIGETAEETVAREVYEEVGLRVKNITYYKSQPWGFDSNLLMGFYCELAEDEKIRLDREELSMAEWVNYKDIPDYTEGLSLTHEMMAHFKEERSASTSK